MIREENKKHSSEKPNPFFAEIIESSLDIFTAQSWKWNSFPSFGSLVEIEHNHNIILGIVTQVQTGSMDPMRYPFPYQKTENELLKEQPQIFEFLKTFFKVQIVGYYKKENSSKIFYTIPPIPCKIHTFVKTSSKNTNNMFFQKSEYLNLVFSNSNNIFNLDELCIAILNNLSQQKLLNSKKIDEFCKSFALLTGNDYRRLKIFLKRIENII